MNTHGIEVGASVEEVFNFLADIERLPQWAPEIFARIEIGRDGWRALSSFGEMRLELTAESRSGFVYLHIRFDQEPSGAIAFWVSPRSEEQTRVRLAFFHALGERSPEAGIGWAADGSESSAKVYAARRTDDRVESVYRALRDELPELARWFDEGQWRRKFSGDSDRSATAHFFGDAGLFGASTTVGVPTST